MKRDAILYILALIAILFAVTAWADGIPIALGWVEPNHKVISWLLYYNLILALLSFVAGIGFIKKYEWSIYLSGIIAIFHTLVWILIVAFFYEQAALKSHIAMNVRAIVWVFIFLLVFNNKNTWLGETPKTD